MNTYQIYKAMKGVPGFVGVFAANTIPYIETGSFIVNTQPNNLGGRHWVCAIIKKEKIIYFDPLNLPISISLYSYFCS